jgi:hypothetical protein
MKLRILLQAQVRLPVCVLASLCLVIIFAGAGRYSVAQEGKNPAPNDAGHPTFSEADAARVMDNLRQAMESENFRRFLKLFDAKKMPGFAAFRDQVSVFFERLGPMHMTFQLKQVTTDGEFGAAVAEITLEAIAKQSTTPNVRRTIPVRLVLGWDGKAWKIVDWSPREFFQ